jgi:signal transduction histidine kinase
MSLTNEVSLMRLSVTRVLLSFLLLVAILTSALLLFVYLRSAAALYAQADSILLWEARYFSSFNGESLTREMNYRVTHQRPINFFGLFDTTGRLVAGNIVEFPQELSRATALHAVNCHVLLKDQRAPIEVRALTLQNSDRNTVVIARDISDVTTLRSSMLQALWWGNILLLAISVVAAAALSVRQARRISRVMASAQRVSGGDLSCRLPDGQRDELDMLAGIVNDMLGEVERLMREVKGTCDSIAHDLRSPLSRVRLTLSRALEKSNIDMQSKVQESIAEIDTVLLRFSALMRISEIESRAAQATAEIDLNALVQQVYEVIEPVLDEKNIEARLQFAPAAMVFADGALLFESVYNVEENAVKFSPTGGVVTIETRCVGTHVTLTVQDYGPGIPASELGSVGTRFFRGAASADVPGSGLGLSLVRAVLGMHGFGLKITNTQPGTQVVIQCWRGAHRLTAKST